jgi:thiamine biosynthesis protein ThiI
VERLAGELKKYGSTGEIHMIPFADAQKEIMMNVPDKFRILFYRRIMLQIAERVAKKQKCKALITGDCLAQVASQTVENLQVVGSATNLLLLRPLIGFDKEEIMDVAKKIGTYEISIEPHDDCCSRLMPKNPEIYAKLEDILKAEKSLDVEKIIKECLDKIEKIKL